MLHWQIELELSHNLGQCHIARPRRPDFLVWDMVYLTQMIKSNTHTHRCSYWMVYKNIIIDAWSEKSLTMKVSFKKQKSREFKSCEEIHDPKIKFKRDSGPILQPSFTQTFHLTIGLILNMGDGEMCSSVYVAGQD